jgi:hypothetical protein
MPRMAFSILAVLAVLLPACADVADDPGKPKSDGKVSVHAGTDVGRRLGFAITAQLQ